MFQNMAPRPKTIFVMRQWLGPDDKDLTPKARTAFLLAEIYQQWWRAVNWEEGLNDSESIH